MARLHRVININVWPSSNLQSKRFWRRLCTLPSENHLGRPITERKLDPRVSFSWQMQATPPLPRSWPMARSN
jgi:hypothetical protein